MNGIYQLVEESDNKQSKYCVSISEGGSAKRGWLEVGAPRIMEGGVKLFAGMLRGGLTGTVTFDQGGGGVSPMAN